jgi:hypothetical protein
VNFAFLQSLYNQQAGLGGKGATDGSASLSADVDSLVRGNLYDAAQVNNNAIQV